MKEIASNRSVRLLLTLLFCCLLLSSITAFGQSTTEGAIGGTVVDPQNKVIRSADVTVRNTGSNQAFNVKTDDTGYFRVGGLQPATYIVTVIAEGFAPYKAAKVIVTVGSLTAVSPHLTIGNIEQVNVTAEAPLINVTSADVATTLDENAIHNLPINGGRWSAFVMLTPGVVSDTSGFGMVSFRGMSTLLNNVTVDGADNNQSYFSEERGRTRAAYSTAKIAIQEFQVNTSNYSAEYGRSAGGVINTVTKSGTNQLHGEAFWYDRDNEWGSMNPFTTLTSYNATTQKATTSPYKPVDVRKMGGFGVGGAIVKDKLFWFFAYDRSHRNFPGTAVPSNVATFFAVPQVLSTFAPGYCGTITSGANFGACQLAGGSNYGFASNGTVTTANMTAVTAAQYATAQTQWMNGMFGNTTTGQLGLIGDTGTTPRTGDQDIFFPKIDWIINQRNHAAFELNRMRWWSPAGIQTQATNTYGKNSFGNDYVKDTWGVAKLDTMFTNTLSNQIRFQYGRDFEFETNQQTSAYDAQTLITGKNNQYGIPPNIYIGSFQWGSTLYGNRYAYPDEYKTQLADTISITTGRHNLRFGMDFMYSDDKTKNLYEQYGEYSYAGLPNYFADLYNPTKKYYTNYYQGFQGSSINTPAQAYQFSTKDWALFAQDDWKLTRRLTVNLGLRFDTELLPAAYTNLLNPITVGTKNVLAGAVPKSSQNWGPRVGFAWDTFGNGKTVLRGGYGIYYGRITNAALFSGMSNSGALNSQSAYTIKPTNSVAPVFPAIVPTAPASAGTLAVNFFDPNFKLPQIHEIDLTLQRDLGHGIVLSTSYMGSFGRHLAGFTDINLAPPGTPYCATGTSLTSTGTQVACGGSLIPITPALSSLTYTVNNGTVTNMPLPNGKQITVPFYTSRVNTGYAAISEMFSGINSSYNALAVQVEKRMSRHIQFTANYTWSHALDYGMNNTTTVSAGLSNMIDPLHPKVGMYGNSVTNVPNRFTFSSILQAPWQHSGWAKYVADGWQAAPVVQMQNGMGNTLTTATAYPQAYIGMSPVGDTSTQPGGMLGAGGATQIPGTERNGYRQPATYVFDMRFSKQFPIYERYKVEFSADGFNLFNHRNVTNVSTTSAYTITNNKPAAGTPNTTTTYPTLTPNTSSGVSTTNSSLFNVPNSANSNYVFGTRQIQLGLRLTF